jgi:hypothetical protein
MSSQKFGIVAWLTADLAHMLLDFGVPDIDMKPKQTDENVKIHSL